MNSTDIVLCAINSTYSHCAFGLRYLQCNLQELEARSCILEYTIKENPKIIAERILNHKPKVIGFGVYIWNTNEVLDCISVIKKVAPEVIIVLGGPEISYETETQPHLNWANYIIKGEADFSFYKLCKSLLVDFSPPLGKIISPELPAVQEIRLPYYLYSDHDIQNRIIYVEASRGCPYKCEYCLSSLDKSVRSFDLNLFLAEIQNLIDRGARDFKFVDRTFNLSPTTSTTILKFFLDRISLGLFLHFEMVPDRLPNEIKELLVLFPKASIQFEIGIQTLNPEVAANVSRKNDLKKVRENFTFLKEKTHVHTHADLIAGLPGESYESFAQGFDELYSYGPDEVQLGILKRLKGTPISRHEKTFQIQYDERTPFAILANKDLSFFEVQKLTRIAKFWDLYANSGDFKNFMQWLMSHNNGHTHSYFYKFEHFCDFLSKKFGETHSHSLISLAEQAYLYMLSQELSKEAASETIINDYSHGAKKRDLPPFLKNTFNSTGPQKAAFKHNERQLKHLN